MTLEVYRCVYFCLAWCMCVALAEVKSLRKYSPGEHTDVRLYRIGKIFSLKCLENVANEDKLRVKWYFNGTVITKGSLHSIRGWWMSDYKSNKITLEARFSARTSAKFFCVVKSRYSKENVVRVFHLLRNVESEAAGHTLGSFNGNQTCPMFRGKSLTLNCTDALQFTEVAGWVWRQEIGDISEIVSNTAELVVSEPGHYVCSYKKHKDHEQQLLKFNVIRKKKSKGSIKWAFCKYS